MRTKCLSECEIDKEYLIAYLNIKNKKLLKHLENLMINQHKKIKIMHKSYRNRNFIIKVMDINYAIDENIIQGIFVYDA